MFIFWKQTRKNPVRIEVCDLPDYLKIKAYVRNKIYVFYCHDIIESGECDTHETAFAIVRGLVFGSILKQMTPEENKYMKTYQETQPIIYQDINGMAMYDFPYQEKPQTNKTK